MAKMLYLIRGLPGSGKSTFGRKLADGLGCTVWEADEYHMVAGLYQWKAENVHAAHRWCQEGVRECMWLQHENIVVANTSTTEKELKPYLDMATDFGYSVTSLVVENRHGNESVHGVPAETMQKMKSRFSVKL